MMPRTTARAGPCAAGRFRPYSRVLPTSPVIIVAAGFTPLLDGRRGVKLPGRPFDNRSELQTRDPFARNIVLAEFRSQDISGDRGRTVAIPVMVYGREHAPPEIVRKPERAVDGDGQRFFSRPASALGPRFPPSGELADLFRDGSSRANGSQPHGPVY